MLNRSTKITTILLAVVLSAITSSAFSATSQEPLRFGIISLAPPAKVHKQWQAFSDYVSTKINRPIEIVVPKGFKKIKADVEKKSVDIFYVNSHIFYRLRKSGKAKPLAQMFNLDNSVNSRSIIFVRKDSGIKNLSELRGKTLAYVSPMGAGGYVAPRAKLYRQGIKSGTEVKEEFTKNLSSSIHKVLLGEVKAGTMCGLNFKLMSKRVATGDLMTIATSEPYPENALGIRSDLPGSLRRKLSKIIINMSNDAEGKKILADMQGMKILRFVKYSNKTERTTAKLLKQGAFKL